MVPGRLRCALPLVIFFAVLFLFLLLPILFLILFQLLYDILQDLRSTFLVNIPHHKHERTSRMDLRTFDLIRTYDDERDPLGDQPLPEQINGILVCP